MPGEAGRPAPPQRLTYKGIPKNMPAFAVGELEEYVIAVFEAAGSSALEARIVGQHLIDANLAGHDVVLAFEPNACIGTHRVNIGGTVVVTADGCEELNSIPTRVTHR